MTTTPTFAGRRAGQWPGPHQEVFRVTLRFAARRTPTHRKEAQS